MCAQPATQNHLDTRACPVCGSQETTFFVQKNEYRLLKCGGCDLSFTHPVPTDEDIASLNSRRGMTKEGVHYPYDKEDHRRQRAIIRAFRLRKYFQGKDVIDIGCGGGYVVDAMQKQGARSSVGVDIDLQAINFCRENHHTGATFFCESGDDFLKRGMTFDFGHSSHVIEYTADPNLFLAGWAQLIRPGGYFFLKTPDRNHWLTGKRPETWPNPPEYKQYFSRKNLAILLGKHGFDVVKTFFNVKPTVEIIAQRKST